MRKTSWVLGLLPVVLCLVLAGFPQSAARAAGTPPPTGTIVINNGRSATNNPNVTLSLTWVAGAGGPVSRMRFSDDGAHWTAWQPLAATVAHTLPSGDGHKTVRVQYLDKANNHSLVYSDYILLDTTPPTGTIIINNGAKTTSSTSVTLGLAWSDGTGSGVTRMRFSDDGAHWTAWQPSAATVAHTLPGPVGYNTVRVEYLDGAGNYSLAYSAYIKLLPRTVPCVVGQTLSEATTAITDAGLVVGTVTPQCSDIVLTGLVISQNPVAVSVIPGSAVALTLSTGPCASPTFEMIPVPAGTFTMGNSGVGDDAAWEAVVASGTSYPDDGELPTHQVTLSPYQIGKYLVTNKQYCDVLNWALAQGYPEDIAGNTWAGTGDVYAGGNSQMILQFSDTQCNIQFSGGSFLSKTRTGLPGTTIYSMDTHPVENVTWFGAAAFCTWLSQMQGLTPCYDMTTADWPLTVTPPTLGGYRLPTEAEWERAAAWDGTKHWIYGFTSDTLVGKNQANYHDSNPTFVNPLGLLSYPVPLTSPVGWFNGVNVSPNGNVWTLNSVSPVGAYDMSGDAWEWCGDWYSDTYYSGGAITNPTGPEGASASGSSRTLRGGCWAADSYECRSATRHNFSPASAAGGIGFRLSRS